LSAAPLFAGWPPTGVPSQIRWIPAPGYAVFLFARQLTYVFTVRVG
jgi:hypothetical protein